MASNETMKTLDAVKIQKIYLVFASVMGPWMLFETAAYHRWGLNIVLNGVTGVMLMVGFLASLAILVLCLLFRQYWYTLAPLIFLSSFVFSSAFCPEESDLPLLDWRMLVENIIMLGYSLASIGLWMRLSRRNGASNGHPAHAPPCDEV